MQRSTNLLLKLSIKDSISEITSKMITQNNNNFDHHSASKIHPKNPYITIFPSISFRTTKSKLSDLRSNVSIKIVKWTMLCLSYLSGDIVSILNTINRIKLYIIIEKWINKQAMTLLKVKFLTWKLIQLIKLEIINCSVKMTQKLKTIGKNLLLPHFSSQKLTIYINLKDKQCIMKSVKKSFLKFMRKIDKDKLKLNKVNSQKTIQLILAKNLWSKSKTLNKVKMISQAINNLKVTLHLKMEKW